MSHHNRIPRRSWIRRKKFLFLLVDFHDVKCYFNLKKKNLGLCGSFLTTPFILYCVIHIGYNQAPLGRAYTLYLINMSDVFSRFIRFD